MRLQHPAEWVLEARADLNLRPDQITQLENLVLAQRDSQSVRMTRMMSSMSRPRVSALTTAMTDWASPINEQAIRDAACEQSRSMSESMLNLIRDQHAVGAILTEAQRVQLPAIQSKMMMSGMPKP